MTVHLSVGVLYDCQKFLELCADETFQLSELQQSFRIRYGVASMQSVLEMLRAMQWVTFDDSGELRITSNGRQIRECRSHAEALRLQLFDYITLGRPTWGSLIPRGRSETLPFLPSDVRQCFNEAGLCQTYDPDVVTFWDRASNVCRGRNDDFLLNIGREGEKLTLEHEYRRTGREPIWKAIDSNLAGYDVLSVAATDDDTPLKIEVKATRRADDKTFFVTRKEWEIASLGSYVFHIWLLSSDPVLLVRSPDEVEPNIPSDRESGRWCSVQISISEEDLFESAGA
ncbi:MAG: DUF3883 domain-containing protein [Vulcanimicrobiaceae bacterium]|jgi:hypothetical protein